MARNSKKASSTKPVVPRLAIRSGGKNDLPTADYRHAAKTKNLPPAGLAAEGKIEQSQKVQYAYNPHLPPMLRFDASGKSDRLPELVEKARKRPLTDEEAKLLAYALQVREPWLEWTGKRELPGFAVDPVALNVHERISAQAIIKIAARQDASRDLFADPELEYREAVKFYQHDIDWANRMILGDSLQIMASLARRENLAGKVQMIYIDPPYGIKFSSNFQPEIEKRDIKDRDSDLTREPETVKAYRDTWTLGVHSYLSYLRNRIILARDLLRDSGSIFVQISDENLHRVRLLLDEVFGSENFVSLVTLQKSGSTSSELLSNPADYILWYARNKEVIKYRPLFSTKNAGGEGGQKYTNWESNDGARAPISRVVQSEESDGRVYRLAAVVSQGYRSTTSVPFEYRSQIYDTGRTQNWKTTLEGMSRLASAERLEQSSGTLNYVRYLVDFPVTAITSIWTDIGGIQSRADPKIYVVQTPSEAIKRCMLMATDPGDLVLDPTCGSGTTAYVAEQWGRRWMMIDSSRVALSLARQRLMTAKFDYFKLRSLNESDLARNKGGTWLRDPQQKLEGPVTLEYKTVPHVTLRSIAQNSALDGIFSAHRSLLEDRLRVLNVALSKVGVDVRQRLAGKLAEKQRVEGKRAISDADRRRWILPPSNRDSKVKLNVDAEFKGWYEWEIPFDGDPDWPKGLQEALYAYRKAWRAKMDEVTAAIFANSENEELVDQPEGVAGIVRVSGPFTMEAVIPAEQRLDENEDEGELETFDGAAESVNAEAFQDRILRLLKQDGVLFPDNKKMHFERLNAFSGDVLHADGDWKNGDGKERRVAVSIGPEYGPVTAYQVENAVRAANRRGVEDLVFAGFSFDGAAQAAIQDDPNPNVRCHLAHIRPDVSMGDLLKDTANSQLFSVFGRPRVKLRELKGGEFLVRMRGVDIYNPVENTINATEADKVAAWFLDSDYDGRTFCITQAFFPDKTAWDKLAKALQGHIDGERFAAFSGTESLPFPSGKHKRIAVKVIDPRGNEVMLVRRLDGKYD